MIIGEHHTFAIEWEVENITETTMILGHWCFWVHEQRIGDWSDTAVIDGAVRWIEQFLHDTPDLYEHELMTASKEQVIKVLFDDFFQYGTERFPHQRNRFILNNLGMSAFEFFDLTLLEDDHNQRLIWRDVKAHTTFDFSFRKGYIQSIMRQTLETFYAHYPQVARMPKNQAKNI